MKSIIIFTAIILGSFSLKAQNAHKIVYDLNINDTALHSNVFRQFTNVLKAAPNTQLELVVHGPAVHMMVKNKIHFEEKMNELKNTGQVSFKICANAMRRFQVDKSELISLVEIVPVAILEISEKQSQGWTYIKAGQ